MSNPSDGRVAYVRFRLNNSWVSASVESQIAQIERQIALIQATVAQQRAAAVLREQGLLFAWARVRADAHYELAALARQPWFESLTNVTANSTSQPSAKAETLDSSEWLLRPASPPAGQGLRLTARLHNGGQLCLWLRPAAWPLVEVEPLQSSVAGDSALFRAVLAGLAAEGHLADVVVAYAQRFSLALANQPNGRQSQIDEQAERQYFLQRAAWLMDASPSATAEVMASEATILQLGELQRSLFVLDEQRRHLKSQQDDQGRVRLYEQEYETLRSLPHVSSLAIRGDRVELYTDTIHVQGICVGSFCVCYDFAGGSMQITNQTRPVYDDDTRYDHPHVREGSPCLGNIAKAVSDLLVSRDLPKLIPLTLDFLFSYNPHNPFRHLDCWA